MAAAPSQKSCRLAGDYGCYCLSALFDSLEFFHLTEPKPCLFHLFSIDYLSNSSHPYPVSLRVRPYLDWFSCSPLDKAIVTILRTGCINHGVKHLQLDELMTEKEKKQRSRTGIDSMFPGWAGDTNTLAGVNS